MQRFTDRLLRDRNGKLAIMQVPNVPIIGWGMAAIIAHFVKQPQQHHFLSFVSHAFLFTWAYLEITKGLSNIRRLLGGVVMVYLLYSLWR